MSFSRDLYIKEAKALNHTPEFIKETTEYAQNLVDQKLPVIFSTKHFSMILGIEFEELKAIIENREHYYKYYQIKKRRGGTRQISAPYLSLKIIQKWIAENILQNIPISDVANGFVAKRSIKNNAIPHERKKILLNVDLLKFFDSITEFRIYRIYESLGYHKNVAVDLAKLCTVRMKEEYFMSFSEKEKKIFYNIFSRGIAVLPQGAPSSPMLSNIALLDLDKKMLELTVKKGGCYTRYADDMTFSGNQELEIPLISDIINVLKDEKLFINWEKAKKYRKGRRQLVTGLTISDGIHVPKKFKKEVKRHLHFCIKYGPESHLEKLGKSDLSFYREWLLGKIYYIKSIEPALGNKFIWEFNQIIWDI